MTTPRFEDIPTLIASARGGTRAALTYYEGRKLVRSLTYGELHDRVEAVAGQLWAQGVRRGDRIAALSANRLEVPVLFLALMRIGAAVVPLNPTSPSEDWTYILAHSRAKGCFATRDLLPKVELAGFARPIDELFEAASESAPAPESPVAADMAVVLYTSGTTGRPKGVVLAQRNLTSNAWSMAVNFGLAETTQLAVLPLYHAHAFGFGLMSALTTGGHLVFVDKFDPFAWAEIIRAHAVTFSSVVPTLLPLLLQTRATSEKVPTLRALLVSSAPLGVDLARDFETRTKIPLVQGWGLSEYTNFACCMSPTPESPEDQTERDELMFSFEVPSIGSPLSGTEVRVIDAHGAELPADGRGEICVRGHSTMISYLEDPEATARTIDAAGWLHTGDEGYFILHRGKRRFFISGRIKEIIIRAGEKHSPIALERIILAAIPELLGKLAILGFPHDVQGEEVGLYLEADALTDAIRARLVPVLDAMTLDQRPKIVLYGSEPIPRTHTGKVQRRKLQHLFEPYAAVRGPTKILGV
jgi:long-chain acyl-CoA synthetase